ncbi:HU family DNA-binding protein [Yoonia sp.]|uniref:HU family DNA-binding protein n=1 Tax=Yoonia sp. TaxID=2212373 RepID=UPI002FDB0F43
MARKTTTTTDDDTTDMPPPRQAAAAAGDMLKKPDLLDEVVARTNLRKRDVKPAVEAALLILGDALGAGKDLHLPPLGKVRVVRSKDLDGGARVLTIKLRTPKNASLAGPDGSDD